MNVLLQASVLALVFLLAVGPILGVLLLLNRRDRRREALLGTLWQLTPWDLRSRIAIQARAAVLSSRSIVTVYMPDCSHEEIWEALRRYCPRLPPRTRLLVEGAVDRGVSAVLRVETACPPPREPRLFLSWG
jgi:hypothetical protein